VVLQYLSGILKKGAIMKKFIAVLSGILLMMPFIGTLNASALNFPLKSQIKSESAIVINLDSDVVINEKNADTQQMPGPLVNIMTAVICLENCEDLNMEITMDDSIFSDLYYIEYSDDLRFTDISNGDVLTVSDLLYAMMLTSSIEASQTLAYTISGGNISEFVDMMNEKAQEIGCTSTHFTNATGMYDDNQYTTARDMAILTEYALTVPLFETIATTGEYNPSIPNLENHENHQEWIWTNANLMMNAESVYYYSGAKGIKTATLTAAGRNIVTMASRDGNNYLVVLMKAPINDADGNEQYYHLDDAATVFDWVFNNFSYQIVLASTAEVGELPVTLADGNDYVLARPANDVSLLWYDDIDISLIKKDDIVWDTDSLTAPVSKGDHLGKVTLKYSGEELATVDLVAVSDVKRSSSKYNIYAVKMFRQSDWFKKAILISIVLCSIYIVICIYSFICYKNNSKPVKSVYAVPKVKNNKKKKSSKKRESDK
jgi:D-alanyl-D-alanine carboxypeptidase (penicillin-binding protein 5/6)